MQVPILSRLRTSAALRLRKAAVRRAFLRRNPDIRRVYGRKKPSPALAPNGPTTLSADQLKHWDEFGYIVLKGFFDPSAIETYRGHIDRLWRERRSPDNPLVVFTNRGKLRFRDALDGDRSRSYRLVDHYMTDGPTRDFSMDPRLVDILHRLMGHAPVVCNTILSEVGSEQDMHSDMFYMSPFTENQMLATWIAIDDVTEDCGPLFYVPGSHKLTPHRFSDGSVRAIPGEVPDAVAATQRRMDELGLRRERFMAKGGDVLIWHSQLVHGGDAILDRSAKRTAIVTHYFSTCDVPTGPWLCAERGNGSLLLVKEHLPVAENESALPTEHV